MGPPFLSSCISFPSFLSYQYPDQASSARRSVSGYERQSGFECRRAISARLSASSSRRLLTVSGYQCQGIGIIIRQAVPGQHYHASSARLSVSGYEGAPGSQYQAGSVGLLMSGSLSVRCGRLSGASGFQGQAINIFSVAVSGCQQEDTSLAVPG